MSCSATMDGTSAWNGSSQGGKRDRPPHRFGLAGGMLASGLSLIDRLPHGVGGLRARERWRHWPTSGGSVSMGVCAGVLLLFRRLHEANEVPSNGGSVGSTGTTEFLEASMKDSDGVLPVTG